MNSSTRAYLTIILAIGLFIWTYSMIALVFMVGSKYVAIAYEAPRAAIGFFDSFAIVFSAHIVITFLRVSLVSDLRSKAASKESNE